MLTCPEKEHFPEMKRHYGIKGCKSCQNFKGFPILDLTQIIYNFTIFTIFHNYLLGSLRVIGIQFHLVLVLFYA